MATRTVPPPGFLKQFASPLWKTLQYEHVAPVSIVEGKQDGFSFSVVELDHRGTGLFSNQYSSETSTFFIVKLDEPIGRGKLTWKPAGFEVCADENHVYLTRPGKKVPVKEWKHLIQLTIDAARSIKPIAGADTNIVESRTWNTRDRRWVLFWFSTAGVLAVIAGQLFVAGFSEVMRDGFLHRCAGEAAYAELLTGTKMIIYLCLLALPWFGVIKLAVTAAMRIGKPGFAWRLARDGILCVALTVAGMSLALSKIEWDVSVRAGKMVACSRPS